MRSQGADNAKLDSSLRKIIVRHISEFARFQLTLDSLVRQLLRWAVTGFTGKSTGFSADFFNKFLIFFSTLSVFFFKL